jgi:dolichol-phosphate mannosyltransferase
MHYRSLAIIATYQESANLLPLLDRLLALPALDLLVIDDNSPDGTGQLAEERASTEQRLTVLHRPSKSGITSAHVLGFHYALQHGYDFVVEMDADFSHLPEDVPRLIAACQQADVAIGSRNVPGGRMVGRSPFRNALTRFGSAYARLVLGLPVRDCTGGFRCTSRSTLEAIDLENIRSRGYGFQLELNHAWTKAGMKFSEIPILFTDRVKGESKMSPQILLEALLIVPRLRLRLTPTALHTARKPTRESRAAV